jgi:hypothetical protein
MCESGLEKKAARFFLTHPQVADLREQPPAIDWIDAEGTIRRHTFDLLVTLKDARKIAVAVKPKVHAERKRLKEMLAMIAPQLPRGFADGILMITDQDLPRDVAHNTALLHHARRGGNPLHDSTVRDLIASRGQATIGELVAASGLGGAAFRATARLIATGIIAVIDGTRIGYDARVAWTGQSNGETA